MNDLEALIHDLGKVPGTVLKNTRTAVEVAARSAKDEWRAEAKQDGHASKYPYAIDYEMRNRIGYVGAHVGPVLRGQGSLGGILEDAPGGVLNAPQRNWEKPLENAVKDLEKGLDKALGAAFD